MKNVFLGIYLFTVIVNLAVMFFGWYHLAKEKDEYLQYQKNYFIFTAIIFGAVFWPAFFILSKLKKTENQ